MVQAPLTGGYVVRPAVSTSSKLQERKKRLAPLSLNVEVACKSFEDGFSGDSPPIKQLYEMLEILGQGSTGVVYRAQCKKDQRIVAVKTMHARDEEMRSILREEFEILCKLSHPHIIQAFDFFTHKDQAALVLEYFPGHSLTSAIKEAPGHLFPEASAQLLFKMLLQAIDYLHNRRIVHRDVKTDNVLVSKRLDDLRLVDFNTARRLCQGALTMTGTQEYSPPEVLLGESPSESGDIWCAGLCLHLMLCGNMPERGTGRLCLAAYAQAVATQPVLLSGAAWQGISAPCKAVLSKCLALKKNERPAAMTLLSQPWLQCSAQGMAIGKRKAERTRLLRVAAVAEEPAPWLMLARTASEDHDAYGASQKFMTDPVRMPPRTCSLTCEREIGVAN